MLGQRVCVCLHRWLRYIDAPYAEEADDAEFYIEDAMPRRPDVNIYLDLRQGNDGASEYYVAPPVKLPFDVNLENMVVFFYPARQGERHGKLTFRLDKVEDGRDIVSYDDR